ncbi:MAG: glycosyltransferase [Fibrobacterota bacterium]
MKKSPRFSIVIVTYNSAGDIGPCLRSIERYTRDFEVIVVDNASRDATCDELKNFPWIQAVLSDKNLGFSAGVNTGVRKAAGEFVILLNPDTQVFPLWADNMAAKFREIRNLGAVGPLSTNCIGYQSVYNQIKHDFDREPDLALIAEKVLAQAGKYIESNILIGFCLMLRRETLLHVGLLDERLFLGNDDLELSWRLRYYGYRLVIAHDAFVAHELQKSFNTEPKAVTQKLVQASMDELYRKLVRRYGRANLPSGEQLWSIEWFKPSEAVKATPVRGPETPLRILLCYHYTPETLPANWEPALRTAGFMLTTVGYSLHPSRRQDIPLSAKDDDVVAAVERQGGFSKYDAFIWFESSAFSLSAGLTRVPILSVGVFSASSVNFPLHSAALRLFDHVIFTEYNVFRYFREQGVENITHLYTNAFDGTGIVPVAQPPIDVSFCGSYISELYRSRGRMLRTLLSLSDRHSVYIGNGVYGADYKRLIANSRIVVNSLADGLQAVTMRAYEAMGQGKLLLTNDPQDKCPFQEFHDGIHYVTFKDEKDLEHKIDHYLANPDEARVIGEAARQWVLGRYTYAVNAHRFGGILRELLSLNAPLPARKGADLLSAEPFIRLCCGDYAKALAALPGAGFSPSDLREKEALLFCRTGRVEEGLAALQKTGEALSKAGAYSLGILLEERKEWESAKRWYERVLVLPILGSDELLWCLPHGMSYERILNIRSSILRYRGAGEPEVRDFADRALSACALFHLGHIALRQNNPAEAEKQLLAMGEEFRNDKTCLLLAHTSLGLARREAALQWTERALSLSALDPQNNLSAADIYVKLGMNDRLIRCLFDSLDSIQILNNIDVFSSRSRNELVQEHLTLLQGLGVSAPPVDDAFIVGPRPVDNSRPLQRYSRKLEDGFMEELDLNALRDPGAALQERKRRNVPFRVRFRNVQSLQAIEDLTSGRFSAFSPLTGERVREYTFAAAENLLSRCGFEITATDEKSLPDAKMRLMGDELIRAGRLVLKRLEYTEEEWRRFFTDAYTLTVAPRHFRDVSALKTSIVMLTFNQLSYTRQCLESIRTNTDTPFELILVDNGSTDGTPEWLLSEEKAGHIQKVILNGKNLGVAAGWNIGMRVATGDYLLILNNDVLAADSWLRNLLRCAESRPDIGMAGPMSNSISGLQLESRVPYTSVPEFHDFAREYMEKNAGNWWELFRIAGFCLLFKREVYEKVGDFDERFGKGNFEDDDYCIRVRRAGYRILVAGDSFLHHFGGVSFAQGSVDWFEQMRKNQQLFVEKWAEIDKEIIEKRLKSGAAALLTEAERQLAASDYPGAVQTLLAAVEKEPRHPGVYNDLGLAAWYMGNVGDAERFFKEALRLSPGFEDAVFNLADVYERRNEPENLRVLLLEFLVQQPGHAEAATRLKKAEAPRTAEPRVTHDREFARELLDEAEKYIQEGRHDEAVGILAVLIEKDEQNAGAYNAMGLCAWYKGKLQEAYWFFRKALTILPDLEDALFNFSDVALLLERTGEVVEVFEKALVRAPHLKEIRKHLETIRLKTAQSGTAVDFQKVIAARELNLQGEKWIQEGLLDKAEKVFHEILEHDSANFVAINNTGLLHWYRNDVAAAYERFRAALSLCPVYEDALINIFDAALRLKRMPEAVPLFTAALDANPTLRDAREMLAQIKLRGDRIYDIAHYSQIDPGLQLNLDGKALLEEMKLNDATLKFLDAIEQHGENSDSFCGLGIIQFYRQEYQDAFRLFGRATDLNPLSQDALVNLWDAALMLECAELARPRLQNALDVDPTLSDVRRLLEEGVLPRDLGNLS